MSPMFQMISNLMFAGMAANQILDFIGKKVKGLEKGIKSARGTGYNDDDILKFISGKMPKGNGKEANQALTAQEEYLKNSGVRTRAEKKESLRKGIGTAINIGSTALAAYGLYNAYTGLGKKTPKLNPNDLPEAEWEYVNPPTIPQGPSPIPPNPGAGNKPPTPPINPNQPIQPPQDLIKKAKRPTQSVPVPTPDQPIEPALPQQPEALQQPNIPIPVSPSDVIRKARLNPLIDSMAKDKMSPESIAEYISESYPDHAKNIESQTKEPLTNSIYRYLGKKQKKPSLRQELKNQFEKEYGEQNGKIDGLPGQVQPSPEGESPELLDGGAGQEAPKNPETQKENAKSKGDVVSLPDGKIGVIEDIKKDHAIVEIDNKKRPVKLSDLVGEPEEIKRAEIIIDPQKIPEISRSSALGFVNVPMSRKDIDIMYGPSGKFYRYSRKDGKQVDENTIKELRESTTMPISSGETYMGAWDAQKGDSRGTVAFHSIRGKAQNRDKVEKGEEQDDPEKEFWVEETDPVFIHGFIKEFLDTLKERSSAYGKAKRAKEKKPASRKPNKNGDVDKEGYPVPKKEKVKKFG